MLTLAVSKGHVLAGVLFVGLKRLKAGHQILRQHLLPPRRPQLHKLIMLQLLLLFLE